MKKYIGVILFCALVSLTIVPGVYSSWQQNLHIEGQITLQADKEKDKNCNPQNSSVGVMEPEEGTKQTGEGSGTGGDSPKSGDSVVSDKAGKSGDESEVLGKSAELSGSGDFSTGDDAQKGTSDGSTTSTTSTGSSENSSTSTSSSSGSVSESGPAFGASCNEGTATKTKGSTVEKDSDS